MTSPQRPAQRGSRWAKRGLMALSAATLALAAAHAPFARGWLVRAGAGAASGCPIGSKLDAQAHDRFRSGSVRSLAGEGASPSKRAWRFDLLQATKSGVTRSVETEGGTCEEKFAGTALVCDCPTWAGIRDVFFRFDAEARLVGLDVAYVPVAPSEAVARFEAKRVELQQALGRPHEGLDPPKAAGLAEVGDAAHVAYRFRDMAVDLDGLARDDGVVMREQYRGIF